MALRPGEIVNRINHQTAAANLALTGGCGSFDGQLTQRRHQVLALFWFDPLLIASNPKDTAAHLSGFQRGLLPLPSRAFAWLMYGLKN